VAGAALVLGAGTLYFETATAKITNVSGRLQQDVRILFDNKLIWQGDLDPGESQWAIGIPEGESSFYVSYMVAGVRITEECGYIGATVRHEHMLLDAQGAFIKLDPDADSEGRDRVPCRREKN